MKHELDDTLCRRYPKIFQDRHQSLLHSGMGRGFECGDGWFNLLDTLCELLQFETDFNRAPQVVATQVKEKLGSLRFYCRQANELQRGMIAMAAAMSARTCEICGCHAKPINVERSWPVLCDAHATGNATAQQHLNLKGN